MYKNIHICREKPDWFFGWDCCTAWSFPDYETKCFQTTPKSKLCPAVLFGFHFVSINWEEPGNLTATEGQNEKVGEGGEARALVSLMTGWRGDRKQGCWLISHTLTNRMDFCPYPCICCPLHHCLLLGKTKGRTNCTNCNQPWNTPEHWHLNTVSGPQSVICTRLTCPPTAPQQTQLLGHILLILYSAPTSLADKENVLVEEKGLW